MPLRVSRCFFIVSLLSGSEGLTVSLVREVSRGYDSRKEGLTKESDYVAVINHSKKFPANRWLLCGDQSSTPVTPVTSSKSHVSHMTWDSLQDTIVEPLNEDKVEMDETALAGEIHDLLDNVPWELEDYILFDVIVIVPELLSPTVSLFGALWRLEKWHNSSLYFLTNDNNSYSSIWIEWSECLQAEIGSLSTLTQNTLTVPIIWRGSLCIQKRRRDSPNLPHAHVMELSDFKLLLRQSVASVGGNDDLCISASAHPSHLELVQLIDVNQVPLLFLSGVQLQ
uniref:DM2 domain-containing protein n=1 Tax=Amphimedon queenslandica TaxID=400682 RepID=A0A1X7T244_AMPQE